MFLPLARVLVAISFLVDVAEQVPKFDLKATCRGDNPDVCARSETAARNELAERWAQFPASERDRCLRLTTVSKMPSYVQVITCLDMARQVREKSSGAERPTASTNRRPKKPKPQ